MDGFKNYLTFQMVPVVLRGLLIFFVGLIATLPAFWSGNIIGHDTLSHLVLSHLFIDQLFQGELYPRWLAGLNNGMGNPVMFFYGPVPYYITAIFHLFFTGDQEGWHQLGVASAAAVIVSGFTSYAWLKVLGNNKVALIGALLYMTAPYHVMVDLYQRFAFAELWGFAWMPLVLRQTQLIIEKRSGATLGLSFSYALLIMTHLPTTLLFSILPICYAFLLGRKNSRLLAGVKVLLGMVLGVGLSAVFLFPALMLQAYVSFGVMESGQFNFANNFLNYSDVFSSGFNSDIRFISIVIGGATLVLIGTYLLGKDLFGESEKNIAKFFLWIGFFVFFMMLPPSRFIWELVPILKKVQFPYRFGTVLTISMIAILVLWLGTAERLASSKNFVMLIIVGLIGLINTVMLSKEYMMFPVWSQQPSLNWLYDRMSGKGELVKALVETAKIDGYTFFLPKESHTGLLGDSKKGLATLRVLAASPPIDVVKPTSGQILVQLSYVTSRQFLLHVSSARPATLVIRQFYFPGWSAVVRNSSTDLNVRPSLPSGLIEVDVPAGKNEIELVLRPGLAESIGRIISLLSCMVLIGGWIRLRYLTKMSNRYTMTMLNAHVKAVVRSTSLNRD